MTTKVDSESNGCILQWRIENISHSWWMKQGTTIESPTFIEDALEDRKWSLWLSPKGEGPKNFIEFFLNREESCSGPYLIDVNYQFAFLDKNGSLLKKKSGRDHFLNDDNWGFSEYATREEIFVFEREEFLPEDTLTVQCTILNVEEISIKTKHLYARTVFNTNRRYFVWRIEKFGTLKPAMRKKFKDSLIDFDLVLNEDCDINLDIDLISFHDNLKYISLNTFIIDSEGRKENCGIKKYFYGDLKKGILSPGLLFPKQLIENKDRFLPNDVLSLEFDFVYSTFEHFGCKLENKDAIKRNEPVLIDDLKSMYYDANFSDTVLRTSTQTFPAHMNILSARSPVFKRMFSNDMKEKNSGHVDITDLEDDTVHRMLLYMYTDSLGDLQFESASKLYAAADKYEILSLKKKCASFLTDNLCPNRACDVLILADLHHDDNLKSAVQSFILEHDEMFSMLEWKHFMDSNIKLAADIMYRKLNSGNSYLCNV